MLWIRVKRLSLLDESFNNSWLMDHSFWNDSQSVLFLSHHSSFARLTHLIRFTHLLYTVIVCNAVKVKYLSLDESFNNFWSVTHKRAILF